MKKRPEIRWWLKRRIVVDRPHGYVVAYVLTDADLKRLGVQGRKGREA